MSIMGDPTDDDEDDDEEYNNLIQKKEEIKEKEIEKAENPKKTLKDKFSEKVQ